MYRGYHDKEKLPVKKGMRVRIPKGTMIHSMRPGQDGPKPAGRTYRIKVDHVLNGYSQRIGVVYPDGEWHWTASTSDLVGAMNRRGLPCGTSRDRENSMEVLKEEALEGWRNAVLPEDGRVHDVFLHVHNPSVRWAGAGGYWSEADINDVEIVEEKA